MDRMVGRCLLLLLWILGGSIGHGATRYAILVGANNGGQSRPELRYAGADAENFANVLQELGSFAGDSVAVLKQPKRAELYAVLDDYARRISRDSGAADFIFYYSGHADEQGLLLKNERVPYSVLREKLKKFPAKVNLLVIDACSSGSMTYSKGGSRQQPFLVQTTQETSGYAIMTSSSIEESSQESERLRSSFFTHFLLVGLRGGADANRDRLVTLTEAYQYAYQETLQATAKTQMGAQHPSYEFQLKGHGDLVLTDLRNPTSSLEFTSELEGDFFVRSESKHLFIEISKKSGVSELLVLEPGDYEIVRYAGSHYYQAKIELKTRQKLLVSSARFEPIPAEKVAARGTMDFPQFYRHKFLHLSPMPGAEFTQKADDHFIANLHVSPLVGTADHIHGLGLGLLGHMSRNVNGTVASTIYTFNEGTVNGAQFSFGMNVTEDLNGLQVGSLNRAYQISGVQLGVLNVGGLVTGGQLGLFNVAESVEGFQVGLINFSERSRGLSLAPIMIVRNGIVRLDAWTDSLGMAHLNLRSGTPYYYSLLLVGGDRDFTVAGAGFGLRLPMLVDALALDLSWGFYQRQIPGVSPWKDSQGVVHTYPAEAATLKLRRLRLFYERPLSNSLSMMFGLSEVTQMYGGPDQKRLPIVKSLAFSSSESLYEKKHLGLMFGVSYSLLESYQ